LDQILVLGIGDVALGKVPCPIFCETVIEGCTGCIWLPVLDTGNLLVGGIITFVDVELD
jgi:hypothetical protein